MIFVLLLTGVAISQLPSSARVQQLPIGGYNPANPWFGVINWSPWCAVPIFGDRPWTALNAKDEQGRAPTKPCIDPGGAVLDHRDYSPVDGAEIPVAVVYFERLVVDGKEQYREVGMAYNSLLVPAPPGGMQHLWILTGKCCTSAGGNIPGGTSSPSRGDNESRTYKVNIPLTSKSSVKGAGKLGKFFVPVGKTIDIQVVSNSSRRIVTFAGTQVSRPGEPGVILKQYVGLNSGYCNTDADAVLLVREGQKSTSIFLKIGFADCSSQTQIVTAQIYVDDTDILITNPATGARIREAYRVVR